WPSGSTQFGELVTLEINEQGCTINGKPSAAVTVRDFAFHSSKPISLRIENKANAEYVGGFNLFGKHFGDYEQDISVSFVYAI
ncbi:transcriptional regulator, ArsR family, partial [human gut metagenome]